MRYKINIVEPVWIGLAHCIILPSYAAVYRLELAWDPKELEPRCKVQRVRHMSNGIMRLVDVAKWESSTTVATISPPQQGRKKREKVLDSLLISIPEDAVKAVGSQAKQHPGGVLPPAFRAIRYVNIEYSIDTT
jgi:hypothetical protein